MARVFVSHAGGDGDPAAEVHRWLVDDGHEVFLDQDVCDGIVIGEEWEQRLYERLRWADAVVCVVTSAYLKSGWCTAEVVIARSRGSRLLPVLAERGVAHPLLGSLQYGDMTRDADAARRKLAKAMSRVDASGGSGWPDGRSPFPGLIPFDVDRRRVFFGRSGEVDQLMGLLRSPAERAEGVVRLVVGPSGCGKSSLVRAGLVPAVAEEPGWSALPVFVPGVDPVAALARELAAVAREVGLGWAIGQVRRQLGEVGLAEVVNEVLVAAPGVRRRHLLVVVDQFEELLTQTPAAGRTRFAGLLHPALAGPVQVVGTVRPEFLDRLLAAPELAALPTRVFPVRPLRREALRSVVERPARLAGIGIGEDLVDRLVDDTDSGEALPLLAFTLSQLAEGVGRGGELSAALYIRLRGVQGAMAQQADAALAEASAATGHGKEQVVAALLRLVTVDERGRPTRWRVDRAELPGSVAAELDAFVTRRLLTTDTEGDKVVVGVAHEAFLSAWPPLSAAIAGAASALRARRTVEDAAAGWDQGGRPPARLWEGGRLAAAVADTGARVQAGPRTGGPSGLPARGWRGWRPWGNRVVVTGHIELSSAARSFLLASIRRDRYRRGRAIAGLSVLLVIALAVASFAVAQQRAAERQQQAAEQQQRAATARLLVAQAERLRSTDPPLTLQLGVAADHIESNPTIRASLVYSLTTTRLAGTLQGQSAGFSMDGDQLLIAERNADIGTLTGWEMSPGAVPRPAWSWPLPGIGGSLLSLSPDRHTLVTEADGHMLLWDMTEPAHGRRVGPPFGAGGVTASAFSPDGRLFASGYSDGTMAVWDISDHAAPHRLGHPIPIDPGYPGSPEDYGREVSTIAFSPDGRLILAATPQGVVSLRTAATLAELSRLPASFGGLRQDLLSSAHVYDVAFSPDGRKAAVSAAGGALLWDVSDPMGPRLFGQPLEGHFAVAFSPDGQTLATDGEDGSVLIWDITRPSAPTRVDVLPETGASGIRFSPDGQRIAVSHGSRTVIWTLRQHEWPARRGAAAKLGAPAAALAIHPGGRTAATSTKGRQVVLWDVTTPTEPVRVAAFETGLSGAVSSLAYSPDGNTLAVGGDRGSVELWNVAGPSQARRLAAPPESTLDAITRMAFTPDGKTLIVADSHYVVFWDIQQPTLPATMGYPWRPVVPTLAFSLAKGVQAQIAPVHPDSEVIPGADGAPVGARVNLWSIGPASGSGAEPLPGLGGLGSAVEFDPSGTVLAVGGPDGTLTLWDRIERYADSPPHRRGLPVEGHNAPISSVTFTADGSIVVTGAHDGTVAVWASTGEGPIRLGDVITAHQGIVISMALTPDGRTLLTTGQDGTMSRWDVGVLIDLYRNPISRACQLAAGGLGQDVWATFIPALPYRDTCE